jgi:predicted transposase YdaD
MDLQNQVIIELVSIVTVYKFPKLSWEAIEAMFGLSELKQIRVYQQALQEGAPTDQYIVASLKCLRRLCH